MIDETHIAAIVGKLEALSERDLTLDVLLPLYQALGFQKVDYHGGPNEQGKDLVLWRTDELGFPELAVAQVKKWKPSAKASDDRSFLEVVNQLQAAAEEDVPHIDHHKHRPSLVYFVTPYQVDTRALATRFAAYESLRATRLKIIDGPLLAQLLLVHCPFLATSLIDSTSALTVYIHQSVSNQILLNALAVPHSSRHLRSFYSDLELVVGSVTVDTTLSLSPEALSGAVVIDSLSWARMEPVISQIRDRLGLRLLADDSEEINRRMDVAAKEHARAMEKWLRREIQERPSDHPIVKVQLNVPVVSSFIDTHAAELIALVKHVNNRTESREAIRISLLRAHEILTVVALFAEEASLRPLVEIHNRLNDRPERVHDAHIEKTFGEILDTGLDVAIFGEAGAGKSTTLQMEAFRRLSQNTEELVLYLPLAPMLRSDDPIHPTGDLSATMEKAIVAHLGRHNVSICSSDFVELLKSRKSILLFDGVDEAFANNPWIVDAITAMSDRYEKTQVVLTARSGGDYLKGITFVGLSLLPFTPIQRDHFIKGWFANDEVRSTAVLEHLRRNPELAMVVSNPLLATTLCTLVEHGVVLPSSELEIYRERMRLLLGDYDAFKGIRRVKSRRIDLEAIARTLALHCHEGHVRELSVQHIVDAASSLMASRLEATKVKLVVDELIHPCNILVPMGTPVSFGFGHLRYQEFLVAEELRVKPFEWLCRFTHDPWWRGALVLYAMQSDQVEAFVEHCLKRGGIGTSRLTLEAMLAVGCRGETRDKLTQQIEELALSEARMSVSDR